MSTWHSWYNASQHCSKHHNEARLIGLPIKDELDFIYDKCDCSQFGIGCKVNLSKSSLECDKINQTLQNDTGEGKLIKLY